MYRPLWVEFRKAIDSIADRDNRDSGDIAEEVVAAIRDERIPIRTASGEPPPTDWSWRGEVFRNFYYWSENILLNQDALDKCFLPPKPNARPIPTHDTETAFVQWVRNEKKQYGTYPPRQSSSKHPSRKSRREWASENDVRRDTVETWTRKCGLTNPRGAPVKK
jgi:hypothetical protein